MNEVSSIIREYVCENYVLRNEDIKIFDLSFYDDEALVEQVDRLQSVVANFCDFYLLNHPFELYFLNSEYLYLLVLKVRVIYLLNRAAELSYEMSISQMASQFKESLEQVYTDQRVDRFRGLPLKDNETLVNLEGEDLDLDVEEFLTSILDVFTK